MIINRYWRQIKRLIRRPLYEITCEDNRDWVNIASILMIIYLMALWFIYY